MDEAVHRLTEATRKACTWHAGNTKYVSGELEHGVAERIPDLDKHLGDQAARHELSPDPASTHDEPAGEHRPDAPLLVADELGRMLGTEATWGNMVEPDVRDVGTLTRWDPATTAEPGCGAVLLGHVVVRRSPFRRTQACRRPSNL